MQANPRTLDTLFNSQLRYVVPMFQRLYVWENSQWNTLWEDIEEKSILRLKREITNPHYLGALIIEGVRPNSPREVKRFLVIDGQQRLTTLQLLFCAYRDVVNKYQWRNLMRPVSRYLENIDVDVMEHPEEERYKLWPTTLNRDVFSNIISARSIQEVQAKYPHEYIGRRRNPEPRSPLVEAYIFFHKKIEDWIAVTTAANSEPSEEKAFALLQALQQDFSVVEIALSEGDDSQEIFYSLNSQGRPLSQSDLLRSLIFMRAEKEQINRDDIFNEYWSRFETPFWNMQVRRGGRSYSRLDLGLRYFLVTKTGRMVDARRVNEVYRHWISVNPPRYPSVKQELADFARHSEVYKRYEVAPDNPLPSTDLRRMLTDFDVSTALPLIMFLELEAGLSPEQLVACLFSLESFIARRVFAGEENKEYNKLFVDVIGSLIGLKGSDVLPALERKLLGGSGTTRSWPDDQVIIEKAISEPIYQQLKTPTLRIFLERLELKMRSRRTEIQEVETGLQIEHVLPQEWATHWTLNGLVIPVHIARFPFWAKEDIAEHADSIRQRNKVLHCLGNLTLLNRYSNPAASNGSFDLKLVEYRNSVLRLNRYFESQKIWDEHAIAERGRHLGELLCKIWPRPNCASIAT